MSGITRFVLAFLAGWWISALFITKTVDWVDGIVTVIGLAFVAVDYFFFNEDYL